MSAAGRVTASERGQCLLCGKLAHVVSATAVEVVTWDLCKGCGVAFGQAAERVAASVALAVDGPAAAVLEHVAGQLELDGDEAVPAAQLLEVLDAFRTGSWDSVPTLTLTRVLEWEAAGFRADELQVMRAIVRNRS